MRFGYLFYVCTIVAPCAAAAQPVANPVAEKMKRDITFQSRTTIPDELNAAVIPYLECVMVEASTKRLDRAGLQMSQREAPSIGCYDIKQKSEAEAIVKLIAMGINSSEDQKSIIDNTLLAIELAARGNAQWMQRAK